MLARHVSLSAYSGIWILSSTKKTHKTFKVGPPLTKLFRSAHAVHSALSNFTIISLRKQEFGRLAVVVFLLSCGLLVFYFSSFGL